ncbi:methylated-DNA--[protein]-cysteine S-methyltransferase [Methylocapsa acidiphila]|uniref:methylated-DNA--[protein]-cysteine S-methyltransferase n=1 Tax=Methylocapsa acidiphila TaxID=133552 RepID=UPI00040BFCF1|nr:methylated-DNA--[protein]-cysteine S-methyltransferase [Methylocapsa acidiphila]
MTSSVTHIVAALAPLPPRAGFRAESSSAACAGQGFILFDTAFGPCCVVWGPRGLLGLQLPEGCERETRARILQRFPDAREALPPVDAQQARDGVIALLRGEAADFSGVALDLDGAPAFHRRVYEAARAIPRGATASYGEIAARLGAPGAARAVGQALARNPFLLIVPCHRVLGAGGKLGGFSAHGGVATKQRLLAVEGVDLIRAAKVSRGARSPRVPRLS